MVSMYYNVAWLYMNEYVAHSISINTQKDLGQPDGCSYLYYVCRDRIKVHGGGSINYRNMEVMYIQEAKTC